jgi:hypothetical protein
MSEPLGDKRKRLDNLLQSTVEEHNQQADELLGVFQRDFPRTYRLLDGPHFQLPARREADYPHYRYAVYDNARTFISATTQLAGRSSLDVDAWCQVRGECRVLNEWMKRGTTTLFVERELGEALKRTDLPEGFGERQEVGGRRVGVGWPHASDNTLQTPDFTSCSAER